MLQEIGPLDGGCLLYARRKCAYAFSGSYYGSLPSRETFQFEEYRWEDGRLVSPLTFNQHGDRSQVQAHPPCSFMPWLNVRYPNKSSHSDASGRPLKPAPPLRSGRGILRVRRGRRVP